MTTLVGRAEELTNAANRLALRKAAAADASALSEALETFTRHRNALAPAVCGARALREHGLPIPLPTNGARVAANLRALAGRIDADPTAVRDRRQAVDQVDSLVRELEDEVDTKLREHVRGALGTANSGLVRTLRLIGFDEAADAVEAALETLGTFEADLPRTPEDLRKVDMAGTSIGEVLAELKTPEHAPLVEFMQQVVAAPLALDRLDPWLLSQLKQSGAAANFIITSRGPS
jgi:hypothetical protein